MWQPGLQIPVPSGRIWPYTDAVFPVFGREAAQHVQAPAKMCRGRLGTVI